MKEIFDRLREEIRSYSCDVDTFSGKVVKSLDTEDALDAINEAEAKWKEDCCEWKISRTKLRKFDEYMWVTSCNNGNEIFGIPHWIVKNYNVCPYCGKRIKIVEVE